MTSHRALAAALAFAFSCAACTSSDHAAQAPPATWSVSFRWDNSDPAVDLDSPGIRAIRAAAESDEIESGIGRAYTYPGYQESAGPNGTVGGRLRVAEPVHRVGTQNLKVVVTEESPTSIDAVLCQDETGLSHDAGGRYPLPDADRAGALWAINVRAELAPTSSSATPPTSALIPERVPEMPEMTGPPGRTPRPADNVFGDWKITRYEGDFSNQARAHCYPWVEQRWDGAMPPPPGRTDSEPPTIESFYPGW